MCLGSVHAPKAPVAAPPPVKQDILNDDAAQKARFNDRKKLAAAGRQGTILTSGLAPARTERKALLGQ